MKKLLILFLTVNLFAGTQGLWKVWVSSFNSLDDVRVMISDIKLLNSARPQPPENFSCLFNVSTNTISSGIYEGDYRAELIIDSDTVEGLISGHPDLEKLSSVKDPLANGWVVRVGTRTWNNNGWIRDGNFDNFNDTIQDFRNKYKVEVSTQ